MAAHEARDWSVRGAQLCPLPACPVSFTLLWLQPVFSHTLSVSPRPLTFSSSAGQTAVGSLDSPSAASGLEPGCVEQPEGLPGITGLSVTLRPFFSLWSRGTPPGAEGDLLVGGEEGHWGGKGLSIRSAHGQGGVIGMEVELLFLLKSDCQSPWDTSADPPYADLPSSFSCPCSWIWGHAKSQYSPHSRAEGHCGWPALSFGHQRGRRHFGRSCLCQWASESRHRV